MANNNTINGIDVSECKYAADTIPVDCENNTCFCYEDENCYYKQLKRLQEKNEKLEANEGRCAFKSLDNTFCDEAKIRIDKLELDKDCLNASLETARKYRGIAEVDRDKYKQALEEIRTFATMYSNDVLCKQILDIINEVLNDRN